MTDNFLTKISFDAPASIKEAPQEMLWLADFNSLNTRKSYAAAVMEFTQALNIQNAEQLHAVRPSEVIAYKRWLEGEGNSPRTINQRLAALSSLFDYLQEQQIIKVNPARGVKRLRINRSKTVSDSLTTAQARQILKQPDQKTIKGTRDYAILLTLFYTGCRATEVCSLLVKDYRMDRGFSILDFTLKGGERNKVSINAILTAALEQYLEQGGHKVEKNAPLFLSFGRGKIGKETREPLRKPLNRIYIYQIIKDYAKGIVDHIYPHMARATFTTTALENECPIEQVQKTVGHKNITTTQMYDHRRHKHEDSASLVVRY